jgi:CBS domain-containing protein
VPLEDLIRRPVQTLPPGAPCAEAARVMRDENIGTVVVADGRKPLGLVTDRDLTVRVLASGEDADKLPLSAVMSGEPIFLSERRSIAAVLRVMRDLSIRRVMVVDESGDLQGLISLDDLVMLLAEQLGDVAEAIRGEIAAR